MVLSLIRTSAACCYCLWTCCRYNPVLYHRFRHSVTSMISSLSLFRLGKIVNFVSLKTRSVSTFIVSIDNISNVINVTCNDTEFVYHLKRFTLSLSIVIKLSIWISNSFFNVIFLFKNTLNISWFSFFVFVIYNVVSMKLLWYSLL